MAQTQPYQHVSIPFLPELFDSEYLDRILPPPPARQAPSGPQQNEPSNPFVDALKKEANKKLTDNLSPAFKETENKILDVFSTIDPNTKPDQIYQLLDASWNEDPELTLKAIWHTRSIHDGKGAKNAFYYAFGWLYANHPRTAVGNLNLLVERVIDPPPTKKKKDAKKAEEEDDDWTAVDKELAPISLTHGYYKDLLSILLLAISNPGGRFESLKALTPPRQRQGGGNVPPKVHKRPSRREREKPVAPKSGGGSKESKTQPPPSEEQIALQAKESEEARTRRHKAADKAVATLKSRLAQDPKFRALYITVARVFARDLGEDFKIHQTVEGNRKDTSLSKDEQVDLKRKLTMASKWAPSLAGTHDRATNISTAVAQLLFDQGSMEGLKISGSVRQAEVSEADSHKIRGFYRRWILSPLRVLTEVVEVKMSNQKWNQIRYNRVPSICFKNHKLHFFAHDEERLLQFMADVASGKKTISGATLAPHELVTEALQPNSHSRDPIEKKMGDVKLDIIDAQWRSMVSRLQASGKLDSAMAICDVSGSMTYSPYGSVQPLHVSIALSLLLTQLAKPPFNGHYISFSSIPNIHTVDSNKKLHELVKDILKTPWQGMNTNFNAVFLDLLLPMAKNAGLKKEDMIQRLFVFSDMQFDAAIYDPAGKSWDTNYERIKRAYNEAGYDVPEMIFWNLAGRTDAAKPVTAEQEGVALLSGFSGNLLKMFMEGEEDAEGEEEKEEEKKEETWMEVDEKGDVKEKDKEKKKMSPVDIMLKALSAKSFRGLKVLD